MTDEPTLALATFPGARSALLEAEAHPVLGRYEVIEEVGAGGMGRVYRARDPRLDREVAIKVTRLHNSAPVDLLARLKREAQAMAQLSHPNVVPVYDVERLATDDGDSLFIAMELVRGRTLKRWLRDARPSRPEILDTFRQAGRGLVAAHEAGLVHRDFKPTNVLVEVDTAGTVSRVRVMDFGLVRFGAGETETSAQSVKSFEYTGDDLTQDGIVLGTPAYMAPEQHTGESLDARSDQYAFCVALHEALFGERPFAQSTMAALVVAKSKGLNRLPSSPRLGRRLRRALLRGLSPDPADRWPTMDALLRELDSQRRRTGPAIVAVGVVVAGGLYWGGASEPAVIVDECGSAHNELPYLRDASRRAAIEQQLVQSDPATGAATFERVASQLDRYAAGWAAQHEATCDSQDEPSARAQRRRSCLERARAEFNAMVDTLSTDVDEKLARRAARLVTNLPNPQQCADDQHLAYELAPPGDPELQAEVQQARDRLAEAKVHRIAGRYEQAHEVATGVHRTAQELGFAPLVVEAMAELGGTLHYRGDLTGAAAWFKETYFAALKVEHERVAAQVASELMYVLGGRLGRFEEAHQWADHSWAIVQRIGVGTLAEARHWVNLSNVHKAEGHYDECLEVSERAQAIYAAHGRPDSGAAMTNENNIAVALYELGRLDEAGNRHRQIIDRLQATLGPEHAEVAISLSNLGLVLQEQQKYEQAREAHARALGIFERTLGEKNTYVASASNNLGWALMSLERHAEARALFERTLAIREEVLGPDHIMLSSPLINLAQEEIFDENYARARQLIERALVLFEASQASEHPRVAIIKMNLAMVLKAQGELEEARPRLEEALALMEKTMGPDHPDLATALLALAETKAELGEARDALPMLDRAQRLWSGDFSTPDNQATIMAARARVYWAIPDKRASALPLARQAQALYTDNTSSDDREALARWIEERA